jgi:NADPH:quinone reductase-like Zn-dependent oxidoreductase
MHTIVVAQVGPGVKDLAEGDVVLPVVPLLGCWAEACTCNVNAKTPTSDHHC